jgi:hypothetical protein
MRSTGIALAVALVFGMGGRPLNLSFTQDSHSMWTRYWGQAKTARGRSQESGTSSETNP